MKRTPLFSINNVITGLYLAPDGLDKHYRGSGAALVFHPVDVLSAILAVGEGSIVCLCISLEQQPRFGSAVPQCKLPKSHHMHCGDESASVRRVLGEPELRNDG